MDDHSVDHELVSSEEAAEYLGIGLRMFQKIVQSGTVEPYEKRGNQQLFRALDIKTLKELREGEFSLERLIIESRRSAIEARCLRKELDMTRYALRLNLPVLSTERSEVTALVLQAEDALKKDLQPSRDDLLKWARAFHGIHEAYLDLVELYVDTKEPWRGFIELGRMLCLRQPDGKLGRELEAIYALLHAGLRILRQSAFFYVRRKHGKTTAIRMFPEARENVHEDVLTLAYAMD